MQTETLFLSVAAGIVAMMAAAIYYKHREHRRRQAAAQTDRVTLHVRLGAKPPEPQAPASSEIGPDHPWYGLYSYLFFWRTFTEKELQGIILHCDRILLAKEHQEAVLKWERLMYELLSEDSIENVREAINELKGKQEKSEQEAAAWRRVAFKNIGADTVGQADKAMAALVDGHRDFEKRFKEQMDLRQAAEANVLKLESELDRGNEAIFALRKELDRALRIINDKDEQIRQLIPVEFRKHSLRNPDGTFKRNADAGMTQIPAPTPVKHLREVNAEQAKQVQPTEARPDHPCLKGCSKPDACFCPPRTPRDGQVEVLHSREDLIVMGCNLTETPNTFHEDKLLIDAWAKKIGLVLLLAQDGGRLFVFSRPAVNSDFDVPNANA